ncbi:ATP-binding protein [Massilia pseudoviolaceinigra]|uniref:ATP-binding protein n=1 Tax=Massilia pseudoviolaceinigra TaxID=3057165 RepID=UPI0027965B5B|nr:ATP-binding protein [Massilia sp. CCM 9206]MDQ1920623.1 ATP-binding protein [Massilia sp. CCM 9206]
MTLRWHSTPLARTAVVCLVVGATCLRLDWLATQSFHARERARVAEQVAALRSMLEQRLHLHLAPLAASAAVVQLKPDLTTLQFQRLGQSLLKEAPAVRTLALSPHAVVSHVFPPEQARELHAMPGESAVARVEQSAREGTVRLAGPMQLTDGAIGMLARRPVYLDPETRLQFWGFVSAVIDYERFILPARPLLAGADIDVALRHVGPTGAPGTAFHGMAATFAGSPETALIATPDGFWEIGARLRGGWDQPRPYSLALRLLMLAVLLIVGAATWLLRARGLRNKMLLRKLESGEAARVQWVADTSHELRTPITILATHLDAMQDGIIAPTPANLAVLSDTVKEMERLVSDLHVLARADAGAQALQCQAVDLAELCAEVAAAFAPRLTSHPLRYSLVDALPPGCVAQGDRQRLGQVLSNLLGNSLRYTDAGGQLQIGLALDGQHIVVSVEDSTPGVPDAALPRLFERFYRVDESRSRASGGSGLGLAICDAIIAGHGGRMQASHSPLGGLRIDILLPAHAPLAHHGDCP